MHKQIHRHAARRLYKRDDPTTVNLDFLDENNTLERRAKAEDTDDDSGVATVYSVVYVTASATFTGATAGYVTLDSDSTTSAKATSKATSSDDETSTTKTKAASTKTTSTSASSAKTTSSASSATKSSSSSASSLIVDASSSTLATSSVAASSSVTTGAALAKATSDSSATASSSATADSSTGLSGGAKAGVAIGVLFVLGLLVGLALFVIRKKKAQQKADKGMHKLEDEKKAMHPSLTSNPVPASPPASSNRSQAPPRLSYRPGSQFAANILGDAEKAAAGATAGAVVGASNTNHSNNPANPFGTHAQTVDASAKGDRPLSPPVELQGSPVPSPTQASFSDEAPKAEIAAVVQLPVVAAASPGAQPNNVHRIQLEFKPSMEDELELKPGQLVRLLHEYDDGWALCMRMDRSQQGVCPRACLSKLPLKPRPNGPPSGPPSARPNGAPNGPPGVRSNGPPRGPPRAGSGPNARPVGAPQPARANRNLGEGGMRGSMVPPPLSPIPSSPSTDVLSPQKRTRSMSVSSPAPAPQPQEGAASPTKPTPDNHRRSISLGNAQKSDNNPVGPSPLGTIARKPVPGQAL